MRKINDAKKLTIPSTIPAMASPRPPYLVGSLSAFLIPKNPVTRAADPSGKPPQQQISSMLATPRIIDIVGRVWSGERENPVANWEPWVTGSTGCHGAGGGADCQLPWFVTRGVFRRTVGVSPDDVWSRSLKIVGGGSSAFNSNISPSFRQKFKASSA